ncbi:hypothetical protein, partial [Paraburkholderia sp. SIMBA_054]|uniref:hypothetical protein n=1 Tax=Paraburkholderia sp. SIMBA_054 TaxID=3085795 RepID=UPI00397D9750
RTRAGTETLKQMQDSYGDRVWEDAIPVDTRICAVETLTQAGTPGEYPGRGLSAYRRALEWILASDGQAMEQAA